MASNRFEPIHRNYGRPSHLYGLAIPEGVYDLTLSQVLDEQMTYQTQINWKARGVQHTMLVPDEGPLAIIVAMRFSAA